MEIVVGCLSAMGGIILTWIILNIRLTKERKTHSYESDELKKQVQLNEINAVQKSEKISSLEKQIDDVSLQLDEVKKAERENKEDYIREQAQRMAQEKNAKEYQDELEKMQRQFRLDFENLAQKILEDKSATFTKQNKENIDSLLKPLGDTIFQFKNKVENLYDLETRDRIELREQIKNLAELNLKMSQDANNLTNALKGQSKIMGDWGEMVLETILERSGLIAGEHYRMQESFSKNDGKRAQPDVILNLPDNKHLVIDSKVSLLSFEHYTTSLTEDGQTSLQEQYLKSHVHSMRLHIKSLSQKKYQDLHQITTPDFVIMFVPLDPALTTALHHDRNLFIDSFNQGIFIVSPTTLIFALRTIANIWKSEKQNRNVLAIAKKSGELYDKFVTFYTELSKLGEMLKRTQECYDDSIGRLKTGKGNIIRRIEQLKKLGIRSNKSLPSHIVEEAEDPIFENKTMQT